MPAAVAHWGTYVKYITNTKENEKGTKYVDEIALELGLYKGKVSTGEISLLIKTKKE
jgi:hypothetical protein